MRTKGPEHEDTRRRILKAARALVLKDGHERLSLRAVAKRAGFSPASLYEYFDSRLAIIRALALEASASLRIALREVRRVDKTRGLAPLGMAYVRWARDNPQDFSLVMSRLPAVRGSQEQAPDAASPYVVVLEAVAEAAGAGVVVARGSKQIEEIAYGLWATSHGLATLQTTHLAGFDADFEAADRRILEAFVAGWGAAR
jgi:AcrR family transcriptional regulator